MKPQDIDTWLDWFNERWPELMCAALLISVIVGLIVGELKGLFQ